MWLIALFECTVWRATFPEKLQESSIQCELGFRNEALLLALEQEKILYIIYNHLWSDRFFPIKPVRIISDN